MRTMLYRRYWQRQAAEMQSRAIGVRMSWSLRSARTFGSFIDYNVSTPGTIPEKMIYEQLINKRVGFYYGYYFGDIPFTNTNEEHLRADFILPDYGIIIEVQGGYWHARPGQWRHDYQRALYLAAAGYKLYTIMDSDILNNPAAALSQVVELLNPALHGGPQMTSGTRPDPTAALRARLRKWPKVIRVNWSGDARASKAARYGYHAAASKVKQAYAQDFVFEAGMMDPELVKQWQEYGQAWRNYVEQLGWTFEAHPNYATLYPERYAYWLRWRNWWNRYGRKD